MTSPVQETVLPSENEIGQLIDRITILDRKRQSLRKQPEFLEQNKPSLRERIRDPNQDATSHQSSNMSDRIMRGDSLSTR
jgi:hypothetical protein